MRVLNEKEVYKKIVEYACSKCNVVCVTKVSYNLDETPEVAEKLLKKLNASIDDIMIKYSEEYFDELYKKLENDEDIFDINYRRKYDKTSFSLKTNRRLKYYKISRDYYLREILDYIVYNYNVRKWINKYNSKIIYRKVVNDDDIYYIRLNETLKKELIEKNSFSDWQFPYLVEKISFYKNDECWLSSNKTIKINCEDKNEYEYLKSLGVRFYEKKFVPKSKNK